MKKRLPPFMAGMLTMALVGSIGVSALAATGAMTITVDPINIQVNGQVFQPQDAKGNDVPVFALDGTTYAPLRALAEAYGLEVGYDQEANMATVTEPIATPGPDNTALPADYSDWSAEEEAAYQEFKGMWDVSDNATPTEMGVTITATYRGSLSIDEFINYAEQTGDILLNKMANRFCTETMSTYSQAYVYFGYAFNRAVFCGAVMRNDRLFESGVINSFSADALLESRHSIIQTQP